MAKFEDVLDRELKFVNFRRSELRARRKEEAITAGTLLSTNGAPAVEDADPAFVVPRGNASRRRRHDAGLRADDAATGAEERAPVHVEEDSNLTGIALSGGGIRSAAFCLGVLQALDALTDDGAPASGDKPGEKREPSVIDALDYMSAVSGGGYIAASTVAGMLRGQGQAASSFPFASKLDAQETEEIKHLRDYSNFLVPNGFRDYAANLTVVLRGLLVNAVMVLPVLLLLAALTAFFNPDVHDLARPDFVSRLLPAPLASPSGLTAVMVGVALLAVLATFIGEAARSVRKRRSVMRIAACLVGCALLAMLWQVQASVLTAMFAAPPPPETQAVSHWLCTLFVALPGGACLVYAQESAATAATGLSSMPFSQWLAQHVPGFVAILVPVLAAFVAMAQKLALVAKATFGEATWIGFLQKNLSRMLLYGAAVIVPLLLWLSYLMLCHWAIRNHEKAYDAPLWLLDFASWLATWWPAGATFLGPVAASYVVVAIVLLLASTLFSLNANSLHGLYRDRLAEAFLINRRADDAATQAGETAAQEDTNSWTFSSLLRSGAFDGEWDRSAANAPYLLLNTAINLTNSRELNRRGRNADTFIFSPLFVGSRATDYVRTPDIEKVAPHLGLATAMAISGAAGSANMGRNTIRYLTPSLALLNIRLGFWLPNPRRIPEWPLAGLSRFLVTRGASHFLAEVFSLLREDRRNVHLTDGGHIENLGIYELLQRRCKVIVAIDAEADPEMMFPSFVALQLLARIDLGVRIELSWQELQKRTLACGTGDVRQTFGESCGPHVAVGIVHYNDDKKAKAEKGILIYIKSSLSGDENDVVRDYKRRHATFPHETTVDQFFSEEQFEVYRALGFHAARGFFTGRDRFIGPEEPPAGWGSDLYKALALLNIPDRYCMEIVSKLKPHSARGA